MCGVAAVLGGDPEALGPRLNRGVEALQHRGPDGRGTFAVDLGSHRIGLGHVRLATRALQDGHQPVSSEDGLVTVSCSGELYDYDVLRRELELLGHRFTTGGDCELIVHLYEEHGAVGCAARLRGEFAFVLWSERHRECVAVRDGMGVRPLLYASLREPGAEPAWLFASEAKALFSMGVRAQWNEEALGVAMSFQYPPPGNSLFQGVREVEPGEVLVFRDGGAPTRHRIGRSEGTADIANTLGFKDAARGVRAALQDAVGQRLRSDVPMCTLLSGGLDSTAVTALAARELRLPAYTVSFADDPSFDEVHLAARTAESLGVEHRVLSLDAGALCDALPAAAVQSEGLSVNHHLAAKFLLMGTLQGDGITVALTGEGADELFFGYPHLRRDAGVTGLGSSNLASAGLMLPTATDGDLRRTLSPVEEALGFVPSWVLAKAQLGRRVQSLMPGDARGWVRDQRPGEHFAKALVSCLGGGVHGRDRPTVAADTWSRTALSGYILQTLSDRLELRHAVEGRPAFLDQEVVALARSLPMEFKIREGVEKAVLREALRGVVPEEVRVRQKHPFLAPAPAAADDFVLAQLDRPAFDPGGRFCRDLIGERIKSLQGGPTGDRLAWQPALMLALSYGWLHDAYVS